MIVFNSSNKTFTLTGKDYSYIMQIDDANILESIYYGKKVDDDDDSYITSIKWPINKNDRNYENTFSFIMSEVNAFGRGDFKEPTVLIERADGAYLSRFTYVKHEIIEGVKNIPSMPHVRDGGKTLTITLKDDFSSALLNLNYTVFDDSNCLVKNIEILNNGINPIKIKRAYSFSTELLNGDYKLLRLHGYWAQERQVEYSDVKHGITRISTRRGASSSELNPFVALLKDDANELYGDVYGFSLIYSGSYSIDTEKTIHESTRIQGGINDFEFAWNLKQNETFTTPQAILCYSANGLTEMSLSLHDFAKDHIINKNYVFKERPIVINNWEATYFNFDNEKLFKLIDEAKNIGINTFVLDDGWFGQRNDDTSSLGDWFVNCEKLKGGLKTVIDYAKSKGLKFGLWFEPEMISKDSNLYKEHPDYAINYPGIDSQESRNQYVLDFTRDDVIDNVYNQMYEILSNNDISYVKWDMNRNITENYGKMLGYDSQGEFMHRYILGVYKLADRIMNAFPNVFFEGCASGGARFDYGMLYYFPQIWTSDDTDGFERTKIQYGTSFLYPASTMSSHVSACPNHQLGRTTPFNTRSNVASLGPYGFELNLVNETEETKELAKKEVENYKKVSNLVLNGDLYRLKNPYTSSYFSMSLVSKDKTQAYVVVEKTRGDLDLKIDTIKLLGLDENKKYLIEELDQVVSGKTLMNVGIKVKLYGDYSSFRYYIREVK